VQAFGDQPSRSHQHGANDAAREHAKDSPSYEEGENRQRQPFCRIL
jgi:hypothetical protein